MCKPVGFTVAPHPERMHYSQANNIPSVLKFKQTAPHPAQRTVAPADGHHWSKSKYIIRK